MNSMLGVILACLICQVLALDKVRNASDFLRHSNHNDPRPPVVLLPGMLASRMKAWKQKKCVASTIEIEDIVWLNFQKMVETMTYDRRCWLDYMKLSVNGSDPADSKIRPDEGLSAVGELSPGNVFSPPGTSIFTSLVRTMARELGYDSNNIIAAPYDWRLAPCQMEKRDSYFSTLKFKIETSVERHGRPAIVIGYSMGNLLFQYFTSWLREVNQPSMGYEAWMRRYIWSYVGIAAPLLGASPAVKSVLSGHTFGLPISEAQARDLLLTCPSTHYLNPRVGVHLNGSNSGGEYIKPIVTIKNVKSANGTENKSFNISDVESGELFRWIGKNYKESHLADKVKDLADLYESDPVQPLRNTFRRPPVKHVFMIYGVDLPTEVAYSYQIQNTSAVSSVMGNGNIAPSAIPTSVVNGVTEWLNKLSEITGQTKINTTAATAGVASAKTPTKDSTNAAADNEVGIDTGRSTTAASTGTSKTAAAPTAAGTTSSSVYSDYLSNPLVLDETFFEDSGCHIANHKKAAAASLEGLQMPNAVKDEKSNKQQQQQSVLSFLSGETSSQVDSNSVLSLNVSPSLGKPETMCKSEVYAVKTVGNPIEFITNGGPVYKRYIISNNGVGTSGSARPVDGTTGDYMNVANQLHSGDVTVPYVSLSHAKTWLNEDSEGCEFNWTPPEGTASTGSSAGADQSESDDLTSAMSAMKDRVIELNKRLKLVDEQQATDGDASSSSSDAKNEASEDSSDTDTTVTTATDATPEGSEDGSTSSTVQTARKLFNKFTNVITTPFLTGSGSDGDKTVTDATIDGGVKPKQPHPQCKGKSKQWHEKIPSRVHKHFLDDWGAPVTMTAAISNVDPATESFYKQHANGDSTAVIEVSGVDHLEIVRHAYVHELIFRHLLSKMTEDLHLV